MRFLSPQPTTTIREKCSCGAEFEASGVFAASAAAEWRAGHVFCTPSRAARSKA